MNNSNDEKIRKALEAEEVPKELEPENIKTMLDGKVRRRKISVAGRITALVAVCAVVVGSTAVYMNRNRGHIMIQEPERIKPITKGEESAESADEEIPETKSTGSYMTGAESYEQVYRLFKGVSDSQKKQRGIYATNDIMTDGAEIYEEAVAEEADFDSDGMETAETAEGGGFLAVSSVSPVAETDYSETYNQEENVLEADIAKTDGRNIYYLHNSYDEEYKCIPEINVAEVDNGIFSDYGKIFVAEAVSGCLGEGFSETICVRDMYLYNDMLAVIGTADGWRDNEDYGEYKNSCFVAFYTADGNPQLVGTYFQEGNYNDVRISPDGYMYLITSYTADFYGIKSAEETERYIPMCSTDDGIACLPADCILLPESTENIDSLCYSVIGGIDLTQTGAFSAVETKAFAGYTGDIYCSGNNLYTAYGYDDTEITRIAISQGFISPEASATVEGRVNDRFSMSEYNGYFRVATTKDEYREVYHSYDGSDGEPSLWDRIGESITGESRGYYYRERTERDNRVYVLDMDMNIVGSVEDFGIDEEIKSVKFSGSMAYVVTYEQTDPLFAIDLSDPTNPTILDEFKILGYSTYMQEWDDGLLLGFGVNADENGIETGVKLTMFDNSDPYNLNALATYTVDRTDEYNLIYSDARWDSKALLIAPEKNLIGVPIVEDNYSYDHDVSSSSSTTSYMFFSYDDGEFVLRGTAGSSYNFDKLNYYNFDRAVYVGDYVYILKGDEFVSVDMENFGEVQRIGFEEAGAFQSAQTVPESEMTEPETYEHIFDECEQ